jgi:hypothetical protein
MAFGRARIFQYRYKLLPPSDSTIFTTPANLRLDDVLLTLAVLASALTDLTFGIARLGWPRWAAGLSGFGEADMTDTLLRVTRVSGWGYVEAGLFGVMLVAWRAIRWYTRTTFNGQNFQVGFLLTTICKFGAVLTNGDISLADNQILLTRAIFSLMCLVLSIYTYRSSWEFFWESFAE